MTDQYFTTDQFADIPLVQDGPDSWPRMSLSETAQERAGGARRSQRHQDRGESHLVPGRAHRLAGVVRVSAFPGWQVDGADGVVPREPELPRRRADLVDRDAHQGPHRQSSGGAGLLGLAGLALVVGPGRVPGPAAAFGAARAAGRGSTTAPTRSRTATTGDAADPAPDADDGRRPDDRLSRSARVQGRSGPTPCSTRRVPAGGLPHDEGRSGRPPAALPSPHAPTTLTRSGR